MLYLEKLWIGQLKKIESISGKNYTPYLQADQKYLQFLHLVWPE